MTPGNCKEGINAMNFNGNNPHKVNDNKHRVCGIKKVKDGGYIVIITKTLTEIGEIQDALEREGIAIADLVKISPSGSAVDQVKATVEVLSVFKSLAEVFKDRAKLFYFDSRWTPEMIQQFIEKGIKPPFLQDTKSEEEGDPV